jgi:uncharacterized protein (TIGR02118 family)
MVSSRAAEWFDALSTRTGELDDRSNRSLPGRPRPHIRHGLLLKAHIPLFQKRMGAAMKTIRVSRGIGGSTPRAPAAFVAMVHATFDSAEVFASAFAPHSAELQGDAPNYTNIQPVVQISEVLMG